MPDSALLVGKIVKPHGIKGLLRIFSYAGSETSLLSAGTVFIKSGSGELREHKVSSVLPYKSVILMKLDGVESKEAAEVYRNADLFIPKESLIREEDEYFWYELLGLKVYLESGEYLGDIAQIIPAPSHDVYVVQEGGKEFFIPATYEFVKEIDLGNNRMVISTIEGLLDLNEV